MPTRTGLSTSHEHWNTLPKPPKQHYYLTSVSVCAYGLCYALGTSTELRRRIQASKISVALLLLRKMPLHDEHLCMKTSFKTPGEYSRVSAILIYLLRISRSVSVEPAGLTRRRALRSIHHSWRMSFPSRLIPHLGRLLIFPGFIKHAALAQPPPPFPDIRPLPSPSRPFRVDLVKVCMKICHHSLPRCSLHSPGSARGPETRTNCSLGRSVARKILSLVMQTGGMRPITFGMRLILLEPCRRLARPTAESFLFRSVSMVGSSLLS